MTSALLPRRLPAVLLGALLALAAAVLPAVPASAASVRASALLASLTVAPQASAAGYSSDAFPHWTALDGTCRTTDLRVLAARSSRSVKPSACSIRTGRWTSAFTGKRLTSAASARVQWAVPLAQAWTSGAASWTPLQRQAFANDTAYAPALLVVDAASATRRGDRGPSAWMPAKRQRCAYTKAWVGVKARWGLTVTSTEKAALAVDLARYCGRSASMAAPPPADVAALTATAGGAAPPAGPTACSPSTPTGADLRGLIAGASGTVRVPAGTAEFADFAPSPNGVDLPLAITGLTGAEGGGTVLRMTRCTSTHAADVPTAAGTTNQLSLLRVSGSPALSDFTLQGTEQGHLYNGLRLNATVGATLEGVTVTGIPGGSDVNPGETFGIDDFKTTGTRYTGVVVDGQGIGASGLGFNSSTGASLADCVFTRNRFSAGVTIWQSSAIDLARVTLSANRLGLNLERAAGPITLEQPVFTGNTTDVRLASDRTPTAAVVIADPVIDTADGRLHVSLPAAYRGVPNTQTRADLVVTRGGVDVTAQVVAWGP